MAYYLHDHESRYTTMGYDPIEVRLSSLESKISDLTDIVKQMVCKKAPSVGMFGTNAQHAYPIDPLPTFHYSTEPTYTYGRFPCPSQDPFDSYSNTYHPTWQDHPYPNEYEYGWQEQPFSSHEQTPPTTNHASENSGMSLEEISAYIASESRWKTQVEELGLVDKWKIETFIEEDDEAVVSSTPRSHISDTKGKDVGIQNPMVVTPLHIPLVNHIKEEKKFEETGKTFMKLEKPKVDDEKVNPGVQNTFAKLKSAISPECKGPTLEIRTDFKAPQHVKKKHVWGIHLLDTG